VGGSHESYIQSCWECDCVPNSSGSGWSGKQNKVNLQSRAHELTDWLQRQDERVIVLVGHSVFLQILTGDKTWLENGEVRTYSLQNGSWQPGAGQSTASAQATPRIAPQAVQAIPRIAPQAVRTLPQAGRIALQPVRLAPQTVQAAWPVAGEGHPAVANAAPRPRGSLAKCFLSTAGAA
ncbi:unnamed protein product, partial [Polarella glacialis]